METMLKAAEGGNTLTVENVKKRYDTGSGGFWALKGVNLAAERGEFIAVVGKSGSGKSTLLNLLGGVDRQTEGSVRIAGREIGSLGEDALSRLRGGSVGFIFQFFQLMPTLTALENVMLPMDFVNKIPARERKNRAEALLERVGLAGQEDKLPQAMSGGEQQRVAIARALANDPGVVLADEPTGNLDSSTSEGVFALLQSLTAEGKTVVMVTHNDDLARRCGRVVRISDGFIVSDTGAPGAGEAEV